MQGSYLITDLSNIFIEAQSKHEIIEDFRDIRHFEFRRLRTGAEAVTRERGNNYVVRKGFRCVLFGEDSQDRNELDEAPWNSLWPYLIKRKEGRTWPAVEHDQRDRILLLAEQSHEMNIMDILFSFDLYRNFGHKLRERIHPLLLSSPMSSKLDIRRVL
jgi:hypothetical protein